MLSTNDVIIIKKKNLDIFLKKKKKLQLQNQCNKLVRLTL